MGEESQSRDDPQRLDLNKSIQQRGNLTHWERATLYAHLHLKSDGASPPSSSEKESLFDLTMKAE